MNAGAEAAVAQELARLGLELQSVAGEMIQAAAQADEPAILAILARREPLMLRVREAAAASPALVKASPELALAAVQEEAAVKALRVSLSKICERLLAIDHQNDLRNTYE